MRIHFFFLMLCLSWKPCSSQAQDLDAAKASHQESVDKANQIMVAGFQKLILEAIEKGDVEESTQLRRWLELFQTRDAIMLNAGTKPTIKEYTIEMRAAHEKLREAFTAEIRKAVENQQFDESDRLARELADMRLPEDPVSYKLFRSNAVLRHGNFEVKADFANNEVEKLHSTWYEVSGLALPAGVSIRAYNWPNDYVDHFGFRLRVTQYREDAAWKAHASWHKVGGLANDKTGVSFRSMSHPDRYIRVRDNGEVWLDRFENNPKYKSQATFIMKDGVFQIK